ncbi:RDD family protein [Bacillus sp. HMF5848]|uniref:RDD family protein n=1 Tax=Bacillus sp. HMF5848 TaxID=2495421 RepID=UPI000F7789B8|nr:RDD family protein [Bacillus sp. HMF5848]RSK27376.1 RDD family protein [Bacillus sp. HMF5848]
MEISPAGFWIRFFAGLLDSLLVNLPLLLLIGMLTGDFSDENSWVNLLFLLYTIIVPIVWTGYTVGKRIVGIRIVKLDGRNVGLGTMLLRTIVASIVYALTLGIGVIVSAFMVGLREDKRAIHDFIAGTYVTYATPDQM